MWFDTYNNCGVWSNWVGQNTEIDKEHDKDCVEEELQLARVKFERDGKGNRQALGIGYCGINT